MIRLAVLCGTCLNQDRFRRTESISLQLANCALHQTSRVSFLSPGWSKCKSNCPSWTLAAGPVAFVLSRAQQKALLCSGSHQGFVNIAIQTAPSTPGSIQLYSAPELGSVQECIRSSLREAGIKSLDIQIQEPFVVACGMWKTCRAPHELSGSRATGTARNGNSTWRSHRGHCPANSWRCLRSPGLSSDGHVP